MEWKLQTVYDFASPWRVVDHNGIEVARVNNQHKATRLMSIPEMVGLLKEVNDVLGVSWRSYDKINDVLSKVVDYKPDYT